jgi:hypothetical protein
MRINRLMINRHKINRHMINRHMINDIGIGIRRSIKIPLSVEVKQNVHFC